MELFIGLIRQHFSSCCRFRRKMIKFCNLLFTFNITDVCSIYCTECTVITPTDCALNNKLSLSCISPYVVLPLQSNYQGGMYKDTHSASCLCLGMYLPDDDLTEVETGKRNIHHKLCIIDCKICWVK
jgi:hypothetical protein